MAPLWSTVISPFNVKPFSVDTYKTSQAKNDLGVLKQIIKVFQYTHNLSLHSRNTEWRYWHSPASLHKFWKVEPISLTDLLWWNHPILDLLNWWLRLRKGFTSPTPHHAHSSPWRTLVNRMDLLAGQACKTLADKFKMMWWVPDSVNVKRRKLYGNSQENQGKRESPKTNISYW